jgi:hypothetical protein
VGVLLDRANQNRENYAFAIFNELPDGSYVIHAQAKDFGENSAGANIPFTIDSTQPHVTLDNPKDGEYYGSGKNLVTITGAITEKNLDVYSLRYGPGDNPSQWAELKAGDTVPDNPQLLTWQVGKADGIADGLYTLSHYAKDKAGSTGEARVRITIDNTPPEVFITAPQDGDMSVQQQQSKELLQIQTSGNSLLNYLKGYAAAPLNGARCGALLFR